MNLLTDRQKAIYKHLKEGTAISGNFLSKTISVSNKTIGREIAVISQVLSLYGAAVHSKTGQGFTLEIYDREKYSGFHAALNIKSHKKTADSFSGQRCHYIIRRLLLSDYVRINELSEELYTSRTTITQSMKFVKNELDFYNISVNQKSNYGLYAQANEHQRRICLVDEYAYYTWEETIIPEPAYEAVMSIPKEDFSAIEQVVFNILKSFYSIDIPYPGVVKTVRLIWLCAKRKNFPLENCYTKEEIYKHQRRTSYGAAKQIMKACGKYLNHRFTREDCILLTIYLVAHRDFSSVDQMINKTDFYEAHTFTDSLLTQLSERNNLRSLDSDAQLCDNLTLHLISMKLRLSYRIHTDFIHNQEIKIHVGPLELAVQAADILIRHWGHPVDENEICLLALVFAPAFWRYSAEKNKRNIIIVSSINRSHGFTMANRFRRNFPDYINRMEVMQLHEIPASTASGYDIVFSDMSPYQIQNITSIPVISVRTYFNDADKLKIRYFLTLAYDSFSKLENYFSRDAFFNLTAVKTKEEALEKAADTLIEMFHLNPAFKSDLFQREALSSGEIGNSIGLMRPVDYHGGTTFFSFFFFERPIIWNHEYVQLLCIWQYNPRCEETAELFESGYIGRLLRNLLGNAAVAGRLLLNPDYDSFQLILQEISQGTMI